MDRERMKGTLLLSAYHLLMTIGELIRNIRKEKGFTQYYLAEKMYCDRTTISKWENNKNIPRLPEIYLLCKCQMK